MMTALLTGGAGDIAGAVASTLAAAGYRLVLADHPSTATPLAERAEAVRALGVEVVTITFDVTDRADVHRAFAELAEQGVVADRVFNNAGYQGAFGPVNTIDSADVWRVLAVNVLGAVNVIAEASTVLMSVGSAGAIVNSASMAGVSGAPNMAAYSASKAAVIGLTKSAAKDLAPSRIRVNAISPAFIGPGVMWDRQVAEQAAVGSQYFSTSPDEVARQMIAMVPMRRYGSTDEVAAVVAFLLSDAASYVTGVNIEIAGGSS
jgi:NAD(P)-dependent dehydrogenase (short-subunit alcohol dehydrogenase family)